MKVRVILLLLNRGDSLVINNKVNEKKGVFKLDMNIKDSID